MRALTALCFLLLVSSLAGAQDTSDSVWAGTWTLNVAKSKVQPPAPQSETSHIQAPGGPGHPIKYTITGTAADGSPIDDMFDGKADGNSYAVTSAGKESGKAVLHRLSSHHYTQVVTLSDGTKSTDDLTISSNGKVATVQSHTTGPNGQADETTVWEKQP